HSLYSTTRRKAFMPSCNAAALGSRKTHVSS
ncbi:MAG: hypothetical protein RL406_2028, partial [Pseudomonadota bacterium]